MSGILSRVKEKARHFKSEIHALYLAYKDPRVPRAAKVFTAAVVGYALSPIDLIPDFIPVLGYLDDLVLLPLGIWLALKMIPPEVLEECRQKARAAPPGMQSGHFPVAGLIIAFYVLVAMGGLACILLLYEGAL
jgi:uncharacterized membrane protein YkvA (DUF1232 family)